MRQVYVGVCIALVGTLSMSIAMNLWKASSLLEQGLPWYRKKRYLIGVLMGVILNTVADGVAFSMTPLSLIAPMQGLTIALTVFFAALGLGGHYESVSQVQWGGIGLSIIGLIICSRYGPTAEAERALWPLIHHYHNRGFQAYIVISYSMSLLCLASRKNAMLRRLLPTNGTIWWTALVAACAGMLAGLLQTQLKVFAQILRSLGTQNPKIICHNAYPGFCFYDVDASKCPSIFEAGAVDVVCYGLTMGLGMRLPAHPVYWLLHFQSWTMVVTGIIQLNTMNLALESNDMAVAMPLYSSSVLIGTIIAGSLFFGEASQMKHLPLFAIGAGVTLAGLFVLAREKARLEHANTNSAEKAEETRGITLGEADVGGEIDDETLERL